MTALETTAADDDDRPRALALRHAARRARTQVAALMTTGADTWMVDLDEVMADHEAFLGPSHRAPVRGDAHSAHEASELPWATPWARPAHPRRAMVDCTPTG